MKLINQIEVKTIKDVLDYIDYGIVDNFYNTNYIVSMNMIHRFLLDSEEINSEILLELLEQTNLILVKLFTHKNVEMKDDYYRLRRLILQSLEGDDKE